MVMISEESCTKDWSNDAENSTLNELNFTTYSNRKQFFFIVRIFHNINVFAVFLIK